MKPVFVILRPGGNYQGNCVIKQAVVEKTATAPVSDVSDRYFFYGNQI